MDEENISIDAVDVAPVADVAPSVGVAPVVDVAAASAPMAASIEAMRDLGAATAQLNAAAAPVFAHIGDALQACVEAARVLSEQVRQASGAPEAQRLRAFIEGLNRLIEKASAMNAQSSGCLAWMRDMKASAEGIAPSLNGLRKMRAQLQVVMILSRIEEERLNDSQGASSLSQNIEALATETQTRLEEIGDNCDAIRRSMQESADRCRIVQAEDDSQHEELQDSAGGVLSPVVEIVSSAREAASYITERYASFHSSTGRVIIALQTEDIARQRNEHVVEVCGELAGALSTGLPIDDCAKLLAMQAMQLEHTQQLVRESSAQMQAALPSLLEDIHQLGDATQQFLASLDEGGEQVESLLGGGLLAIERLFASGADSLGVAVSLVNEQMPKVEKMIRSAEALEDLEDSVQLVSINATIKTAHLGARGNALEVVATELHKIARSGQQDMESLSKHLSAMRQAMRQAEVSSTAMDVEGIPDCVSAGGEAFRVWSQLATQRMGAVRELSDELDARLQEALAKAVELASFADTYQPTLQSFEDSLHMLGHTRESALAVELQSESANELMGLYSMQSERDVHAAAVNSGAAGEASAAVSSEEFGDDIELF